MIRFGQNQKSCFLKSIRSFTAMGKYEYRQTSHDACLNGTPKQFAV